MGGGIPSFLVGTFLVGLGAGLFGHSTLAATMRSAPRDQIGLALGTWGAAQATAAGVRVALAGIVRDVVVGLQGTTGNIAQTPYKSVFVVEVISLFAVLFVIWPLVRQISDRVDIHTTHAKQVEGS